MKYPKIILGAALLLVAAALASIALTHRPTSGMIDAIRRFNDGALKPEVYYSLLAASVALALTGIWQLIAGLRPNE